MEKRVSVCEENGGILPPLTKQQTAASSTL